jgi:hypothetical protein
MFPGRLAAPRFVQYGQDYNGAPDDWVYVYFPGTQGDSAFFENNDQILLARVHKENILERSAYEFFNGIQLDGSTAWTTDSTIATVRPQRCPTPPPFGGGTCPGFHSGDGP